MSNKRRTLAQVIGLDRWEVRRTIWPYADGWGTYNPFTNTVLDTGLSKTEAQQRCDALNAPPQKESEQSAVLGEHCREPK